jgi:hypothetical protein
MVQENDKVATLLKSDTPGALTFGAGFRRRISPEQKRYPFLACLLQSGTPIT